MTARATFTQATMQRAIRAAAREGAVVRVVRTDQGDVIEIDPKGAALTAPPADPKVGTDGGKPAQPGEW